MSIRLSRILHGRLRVLAEQEGISINQLVATAVAVLDAEAFFAERAARGDRAAYDAVPEGEVTEGDEVG